MMVLDPPRVLVCGSRHWRWPRTVTAVLERLHQRYGDRLVIIEGRARGADAVAHAWCKRRGLSDDRHRCFPVDWDKQRRIRPDWRAAGPERNQVMLTQQPRLVAAFHDAFDPARGGTSDMVLRALLAGVPAWLTPGADPDIGHWLSVEDFPAWRIRQLQPTV